MTELTTAQKYARGLIRLLKEYAGKLEGLAAERHRRATVPPYGDWSELKRRVQAMRPALLNVTREASGQAEQGDVRDLARLELRLRLAEVEELLQALDMK